MRYIQLYKLVDNLVVHADATTEKINSYIKGKNTIKIEHGYFYAEFRNQIEKKKKYDLAMIGNILPYKGVEDAIEALSYLSNPKIKMLVAGKCSEEYYTVLNKLIDDKKLGKQVDLKVGFLSVERLIESYAQSSVSIMPYKEIEQSGVLYTSLGLKVPVIGYESGGIAETITNNCNGYLVKKNDVQALANAIEISLRKCDIWVSYIENNGNYDIWRNNAKILKEHYLQ